MCPSCEELSVVASSCLAYMNQADALKLFQELLRICALESGTSARYL